MQFDRITNFKDREGNRFCAAKKCYEGENVTDLSGDFLLPDYLPDAKKLLRTTVTPTLGGRFLGSGCLEYDGSLRCDVLYYSEDGKLRCASFELPFEGKFESENINGDCVELLRPKAEGVTCRMQGPRKLNLRCKAGAKATLFCRDSVMPTLAKGTSEESAKAIETLLKDVTGMNVTNVLETELQLSEDLPLDKTMPPIDGIVCSHAELVFDRCRPGSDGLLLRGRAELECLYYTETTAASSFPASAENSSGNNGSDTAEKSETYTLFRRSIPFEELLDSFTVAEGDRNENYRLAAFGCVQSLKVTPAEDENGQMRVLEVDLNYGADVRCISDVSLQITEDAYSLKEGCALTKESLPITLAAGSIACSFTSTESLEWKTLGGGIDELLAVQLLPKFSETPTASRRGLAMLTGEVQAGVAGIDRDGNPQLLNFTLPLRYESDLPMAEEDKITAEISAACINPRLRFDPEQLSIDFETILQAMLLREEEYTCVTGITPDSAAQPRLPGKGSEGGDTLLREKPSLRKSGETLLFYPERSETLWDAAKRYRVTREALAFENGIADGAPLPRVLLIPRGNQIEE